MGFVALGTAVDNNKLKEEYANAYGVGLMKVGDECLFFKRGFKKFYIPYSELKRCFRRVMVLPVKNRKTGENSLQVEYAVIMNNEKELAEVQLPGHKAAEELLEKIHEKAPDVILTCPRKLQKKNERNKDSIEL